MNNNLFDKFLDRYDAYNERNRRIEYRRIIKKPPMFECVLGFGFSFLILVVLIIYFSPTKMYFVILIGDLLFLAYYGVNLFTKKGFGLPATVAVVVDDQDKKVQ